MLHLLIGTDWTANRDEILSRISRDVKDGKRNRILLVPELVSHEMERQLCTWAGDTASRYAEVLSFTRLGRRVCEYMGCGGMEALDKGGRVVAMAAAARQLHSRLKAYAAVEGNSHICFVIGGSNGLDDRVKNMGKIKLSFSKMTFPHQLMRVILAEQIYRAFTISSGGKYHK